MTDKAVSALTSLTGANTATGDLLYIVDISEAAAADRSKKITAQELQNYLKTFPATIGVGGATPAASGAGVSFPATASASSDANTLDDYEEGIFSATITDGTTSVSVSNSGIYTKIGRFVTCHIVFYNQNISGLSTSGLRIGNLPFTASLDCASPQGTFSGTAFSMWPNVPSGNNYAEMYFASSGGPNVQVLTKSQFDSASQASIWAALIYVAV